MSLDTETKNVPKKYQRLTKTEAFTLVGEAKSTFYRKYLNGGEISVSTDESGKEYIAIDELIRVFGMERVLKGIHESESKETSQSGEPKPYHETDETYEKTPHTRPELPETSQKSGTVSIPIAELMQMKVELAKSETELKQVKERLREQTDLATLFQRQYFEEAQLSKRLLEDKQRQNGLAHESTEDPSNNKKTKSFLSWLGFGSKS